MRGCYRLRRQKLWDGRVGLESLREEYPAVGFKGKETGFSLGLRSSCLGKKHGHLVEAQNEWNNDGGRVGSEADADARGFSGDW